jgi:hypothetical protein
MRMLKVTRQFHVRNERHGRKCVIASAVPILAIEHMPRVAKLMALAIQLDALIMQGVIAHQAEFARVGRVMRARLTVVSATARVQLGASMFVFLSNRLGCVGSIVASLIGSIILIAAIKGCQ